MLSRRGASRCARFVRFHLYDGRFMNRPYGITIFSASAASGYRVSCNFRFSGDRTALRAREFVPKVWPDIFVPQVFAAPKSAPSPRLHLLWDPRAKPLAGAGQSPAGIWRLRRRVKGPSAPCGCRAEPCAGFGAAAPIALSANTPPGGLANERGLGGELVLPWNASLNYNRSGGKMLLQRCRAIS